MANPRTPLLERFWSKVNKTDTCWLWQGFLIGETAKRLLVVCEKPWGIRSRQVAAHEPTMVPKTAVALVRQYR